MCLATVCQFGFVNAPILFNFGLHFRISGASRTWRPDAPIKPREEAAIGNAEEGDFLVPGQWFEGGQNPNLNP